MKGQHRIALLCEVLGVSRSGYYQHRAAPANARQREDAVLQAQIVRAHRASRCNYGAPRIVAELRAQGLSTSKRRCARLMRAAGLRGRKKPRRRPRTTDSDHGRPVPANRLGTRPAPTRPDQVWVTDITYLRTAQGWLFLAAVMDLWSRRIVGWACAPTLHASLPLAALRKALRARRPGPDLMHHSDRGCQYIEHDYVRTLEQARVQRSMSRSGNCYDNAAIESFWSTLKTESGIEDDLPTSRLRAELTVFDYIETFYNPVRRHSSLGCLSPVAFENQNRQNHTLVA
jgi:transposase InsO family protein